MRLVLSKQADAFNKQQVMLRLDEPIAGASHPQAIQIGGLHVATIVYQ